MREWGAKTRRPCRLRELVTKQPVLTRFTGSCKALTRAVSSTECHSNTKKRAV